MDAGKLPLTFKIYKGDQLIRTETLSQPVIKIGKLTSSHLRIDDELVSRMHAVIEVTGGEISIIDLGSTKGTLVNGQKVNKARLQDGDTIVLGDTRIVLAIGATAAVGEDTVQTSAVPSHDAAPGRAGTESVFASSPAPGRAPAVPAAPPTFRAPAAPSGFGGSGSFTSPQPTSGSFAAPQPSSFSGPGPASGSFGAPQPQSGSFGAPQPPSFSGPAPSSFNAPPAASPLGGGGPPMQFGMDAGSDATGRRAIEVAAMLQDSVVAVKHVVDPRGGKVSGGTWGLIAAGAVLMLMSLIAFGRGISTAATNHEQFVKWVEVDRKSALDFRPKRDAPVWDAMAIGGLALSLISITLGIGRAMDEKKSPYFRIGQGQGVEFPTADVPAESFELVGPRGDDFVFSWMQGMRGEMVMDGKATPLDQLPQTMAIPLGARIRVETGTNTFLVSSVPAPATQTSTFLATLESTVMFFFFGSALVHGLILALLYAIPPDEKSLALDQFGNNDRLAKVEVKPPEDPKQLEDLNNQSKDDGQQSGGTGTKQAMDEGKMGKKDSTRQSGQYAMKNMGADPQLAKLQAQERAQNSGFLGALRSQPGGAFASLTGTGDFSSGLDDRDVYGGLIGNEVGEMQGGWGYGISGTGPGGGGTGLGTIGLGRYGTIGHGSGTGTGYGVGSGKGGMRGRSASQPRVNIGNATATGDLDKNIIRRYIRQKLPQIEHCYEKQLVVKPSLAGTVTTQFTISGTGNVIQSRASGLGDSTVESCVAGVIQSIQFPKPTGGGIVNVTYPFTFRAAGE